MHPKFSNEFRRCLVELDIPGIRKLWQHISPGLPQPKSDLEALTTLHLARTVASSLTAAQRLYSHDWLLERGLPSQLPDDVLPVGRRTEKRIVGVVGISINMRGDLAPAGKQIERVVSNAVAEAYADGRTDNAFLKARIAEVGRSERKKLLGRTAPLK